MVFFIRHNGNTNKIRFKMFEQIIEMPVTTIIWGNMEGGTINAGDKSFINARIIYDSQNVKEGEEQSLESFLKYVALLSMETAGDSRNLNFKLETPAKEQEAKGYFPSLVNLELEISGAGDKDLHESVKEMIMMAFFLYQVPKPVINVVSMIFDQFPGTAVTIVMEDKIGVKVESEQESGSKIEPEFEQEPGSKIEPGPEQKPDPKPDPKTEP